MWVFFSCAFNEKKKKTTPKTNQPKNLAKQSDFVYLTFHRVRYFLNSLKLFESFL